VGRALLVELEALEPADFSHRIDRMGPNLAIDSSSAAESIDRSLERLDQLFLWGHWSAEKYRAERERLEDMRKELTKPAAKVQAEEPLTDLVATWDKGDAVGRRELLAQLFTDIHILNGRVNGYSPRPDRAPDLIRKIDLISKKVSVSVGGDGPPSPLTDSLHLMA
jgi:hypothetical protein